MDFIIKGLMWFVIVGDLIAYLPQIVKSIRTKKAEDLSKSTWFLWTSTSVAQIIYYTYIGDPLLVLSESTCLACNLTIFALSVKYRDRAKDTKLVPVEEPVEITEE